MRDIKLPKNKELVQQKQEVKFVAVVKNHGNKKGLVEPVQDQVVLHYGEEVVLFLDQNQKTNLKVNKRERNLALQTLLYNKRKNIIIVSELESLINKSKTKVFCNYLNTIDIYNILTDEGEGKHRRLDLSRKTLVVVSKKTTSLKLATQNLKNVELILASNLNTATLLKTDQILLTLSAVKVIKEIFCD